MVKNQVQIALVVCLFEEMNIANIISTQCIVIIYVFPKHPNYFQRGTERHIVISSLGSIPTSRVLQIIHNMQ